MISIRKGTLAPAALATQVSAADASAEILINGAGTTFP
jgi:hypothetical protein